MLYRVHQQYGHNMAKTIRKSKKEQSTELLQEGTNSGIETLIDLYNHEIIIESDNKAAITKPLTIFDHINNLTINKTKWEELADIDKKSFNRFMIILWLAMSPDLVQLIDQLQQVAIELLTPRDTYKLLYDFLPQQKFYLKFIKGAKDAKFNEELVLFIADKFECSTKQAKDNLEIYLGNDTNIEILKSILQKYGKDSKEIKKLIEIKL